jgi:antitoxin CcdA
MMKGNAVSKRQTNEHIVTVKPSCQQQDLVDTESAQQDRGFIKAMNEFTARAGLLSEDPFFEGI